MNIYVQYECTYIILYNIMYNYEYIWIIYKTETDLQA